LYAVQDIVTSGHTSLTVIVLTGVRNFDCDTLSKAPYLQAEFVETTAAPLVPDIRTQRSACLKTVNLSPSTAVHKVLI